MEKTAEFLTEIFVLRSSKFKKKKVVLEWCLSVYAVLFRVKSRSFLIKFYIWAYFCHNLGVFPDTSKFGARCHKKEKYYDFLKFCP